MGGGTAYTKSTSFGFSHWIEEPFDLSPSDVSSLDLPGSKKAGLLLRFRDIELVVTNARAISGEHRGSKKRQIEFVGRTVEAIRKATTYFTAVSATSVSFYVSSEVERDHLMHLVELNTHVNPIQSPSQTDHSTQIPLAIPVVSLNPPQSSNTPRIKQVIESGFKYLEEATNYEEKERWSDALQSYEAARRCFNQASPQIPSEKASTRQLLMQKSAEILDTISQLQHRLIQPPTSSIPAHFTPAIPPASIPTAPPPQPISPVASSPSIDERMHQLQKYSETVDVKRAQIERRADTSDLALRLAALKRETTIVPPEGTLDERLRRLRGCNGAESIPNVEASNAIATATLQDPFRIAHESAGELNSLLDDNPSNDLDDEGDTPSSLEIKSILRQAQEALTIPPVEFEDEDKQVDKLVRQIQEEVALGIDEAPKAETSHDIPLSLPCHDDKKP